MTIDVNEKNRELQRRLKEIRRETRLSLRDVAERTGVSASTLSRFENQKHPRLDPENMVRLAAFARVDVGAEGAVVSPPGLASILRVIATDDALNLRGKAFLSQLMEHAYKEFARHERQH